ncbi:hypothetical protein BC628DRAFT_1192300 [Trametes gibbosa]|nr:hypothetical protein BC628DRAFT_1192300 [Trametes gibbosa]
MAPSHPNRCIHNTDRGYLPDLVAASGVKGAPAMLFACMSMRRRPVGGNEIAACAGRWPAGFVSFSTFPVPAAREVRMLDGCLCAVDCRNLARVETTAGARTLRRRRARIAERSPCAGARLGGACMLRSGDVMVGQTAEVTLGDPEKVPVEPALTVCAPRPSRVSLCCY